MKIQSKIIFSIIALFILSCSQKNNLISTHVPSYKEENLLKKLETFKKKNQKDSLESFFSEWNKNISSNNQDFTKQSDTIKAIYDVYKSFYKPLDLLKLGDWEWGNKLNSGAKYIVIATSISYFVSDSDSVTDSNDKNKILTISDFRPIVDIDKSKVLYLIPEYKNTLNRFLGNNSTKLGKGNIMNPSLPKGESESRYNFIRPFIPILHGHWGGYWHLSTHPSIEKIIFNRDLTKAILLYRVGYQGGETLLEMNNSKWNILKSKATWIE